MTFHDDIVAAMPRLRKVAWLICRNNDRADDMVQDAIVLALTHQDKFEAGTNLHAWLYAIMRNKYRTDYRKRLREVEDPDEMIAKAVPVEDSPLTKMEVREVFDRIDRMPTKSRDTLKMLANGASYNEMAAELGDCVGTIKSRICRRRAELLEAL